jgi:voltage-gated potassium channel
VLQQLQDAVRRHFSPHRHSALLAAIIAAFVVRPLIGDVGAGPTIFSILMVVLLLVALYNINIDEMVGERGRLLAQSRRRRAIGWALALAAISERLILIFVHSRALNLAGAICWFLFLLFVTLSQLRSVLRQREVTGETISMAISVYALLAFTWAFIYLIIFQRHSGAFGGLALSSGNTTDIQPIFPVLGYYSLGTLSTIGAGDIVPISLQARYATVAEAITGQFYLAILVARLVGLQMSQSSSQRPEDATRGADILVKSVPE